MRNDRHANDDDSVFILSSDVCLSRTAFKLCPLSLQLAVDVAFRLAELAGDALEGFFFVDAILGLKAGDAVGNFFLNSDGVFWAERSRLH
jgi:hypothetical protein